MKKTDGRHAVGHRVQETLPLTKRIHAETGKWKDVMYVQTWEIWLEAKAKRVVFAECISTPEEGAGGEKIRTYKDFVYNAPVDDSLFSMEPEGYTLRAGRAEALGFSRDGKRAIRSGEEPYPPARWKEEYGDRAEVVMTTSLW